MYREYVLPMIRENYPDGVEPEEEPREYLRRKKENPLTRLRSHLTNTSLLDKASFSRDKGDEGDEGDDEELDVLDPQQDDEVRPPAFFRHTHGSFISERRPNLTMQSQIEKKEQDPRKFNTSSFYQFKMLTKRGFQSTKNFPAMIIFISLYSLFLAVFYGTLFFQLGYNQADITLRSGICFNIVMILGFQVFVFCLNPFLLFFSFLFCLMIGVPISFSPHQLGK